MSRRRKLWALVALSVGIGILAVVLPPTPQPQEYHRFADDRAFLGIPNFFDVMSNLFFLLVGIAGLIFVFRSGGGRPVRSFLEPGERWPYLVLFLSVATVWAGSAYYHLAPDNDRLVWDRLPIAIGIMALLGATLNERIHPKLGSRLLPLLMAMGAGSLAYWHWSEQQGAGNLNFYIAVQFYSLLVVFLLVIFFPARYTRGSDIHVALAFYGLAKAAEFSDRAIYDLGHLISGHTAKHLLAAAGIYWILRMLKKRAPLPATASAESARAY